MNKRLLRQLLPHLLLLALAGGVWVQAGLIEGADPSTGVGPGLWPRTIAAVLAFVCACSLVSVLRHRRDAAPAPREAEPEDGLPALPETHPWLVWAAVLATGVFVGTLETVGFVFGAALYAMVLLVVGGMRRWALVPVYGVVLSLVFTGIFMKVVYVALPLGEGVFRELSLAVQRLMGIH